MWSQDGFNMHRPCGSGWMECGCRLGSIHGYLAVAGTGALSCCAAAFCFMWHSVLCTGAQQPQQVTPFIFHVQLLHIPSWLLVPSLLEGILLLTLPWWSSSKHAGDSIPATWWTAGGLAECLAGAESQPMGRCVCSLDAGWPTRHQLLA